MSGGAAPLHNFTKDLYKLLRLPRTATQIEIKQSYRKIALALHPDRHDGCAVKTGEFKRASEAYRILSDYSVRVQYDRWLDGVTVGEDGKVRKTGMTSSRAAERNPFYRKVYSPAAPPGMKTFDRQRHYDMHYGDGMMNEEIERARRRAAAASPRETLGNSYRSPLGAGFGFAKSRPAKEQTNPYSRKGKRQQHDHLNSDDGSTMAGGFRIEYEESYFEMNGMSDLETRTTKRNNNNNMSGREYVVERMNDRRKERVRERGEPNRHTVRRRREMEMDSAGGGGGGGGGEEQGCVIM